ncbi:MAG: aldo/keto reductase, partial [Proteobacteria bacterium]|nr:aldo/keto reductase [Pseudomonadota bacterium]
MELLPSRTGSRHFLAPKEDKYHASGAWAACFLAVTIEGHHVPDTPAKYRILGKTGLFVSELCLGTMTFGGEGTWKVMGGLDQAAATAITKAAFDAGVTFIDTANVYSIGQSEILLGNAIRDLGLPRDEIVIATKATGMMSKDPNGLGHSRYHLMNQVDASLRRLGIDHIDLYQLHGVDARTPIEETLETLNDLVRSGKVRYTGVCNMSAWQVMKAIGICEARNWTRLASVQAYYTIAGRDLEREIVPMLQDQSVGLMVWSPLAGGLLAGKFDADRKMPEGSRRATFDFPIVDKERAYACVDAMRPIATKHGASVAQVALAWLLHQKAVTSV